jgi:hypothetical protein
MASGAETPERYAHVQQDPCPHRGHINSNRIALG